MILRAKTSTCFFEEREGKGHSSTHNTRAFFPHCFCFYVGTLFWLIWSFFQVHELVLQCLVTADLIQCTFYFRYCAFHDLKFHLVYSCSPPYTYTHTHTHSVCRCIKTYQNNKSTYFCFIMFVFSFKSLSIFNIKSILKSLCINFIIFIIYWFVYCSCFLFFVYLIVFDWTPDNVNCAESLNSGICSVLLKITALNHSLICIISIT